MKETSRPARIRLRLSWRSLGNALLNLIALGYIIVKIVYTFLVIPLVGYASIAWVIERLLHKTSLEFQFAVLLIFFPLLVYLARDFISESRARLTMSANYRNALGDLYPLSLPIVFVAIVLPYFSGLSCTLKAANLVRTAPDILVTNDCILSFSTFYIWHILDAVPILKIPQTLQWTVPYEYTGVLLGFILLTFKIVIIFPIIRAFVLWRKIHNKDEEENSKSEDVIKVKTQAATTQAS